jgi:hypothetical protein
MVCSNVYTRTWGDFHINTIKLPQLETPNGERVVLQPRCPFCFLRGADVRFPERERKKILVPDDEGGYHEEDYGTYQLKKGEAIIKVFCPQCRVQFYD